MQLNIFLEGTLSIKSESTIGVGRPFIQNNRKSYSTICLAPGTPPQSALKRAPRLNLRMKSISLDQPTVNSKQQQQAVAGSNIDSGGNVGSSSRGNSCSRWPGISATIASIRGGGPTLMQRTQRQGEGRRNFLHVSWCVECYIQAQNEYTLA